MKANQSNGINRPFEGLNDLFKGKKISLSEARSVPKPETAPEAGQDSQLFSQAMADVIPVSDNRYWRPPRALSDCESAPFDDDRDTIEALEALIASGKGFMVSQTGEYMEAAGPGAGPEIIRRLHHGHYAIEGHIDLHGHTVTEAEAALQEFIQNALERDRRTVLVIHGRGLASPGEPVLKSKVFEWLTRGALRKHVIALTSARSCDGGAGATYVLLRRNPLTKRSRKR